MSMWIAILLLLVLGLLATVLKAFYGSDNDSVKTDARRDCGTCSSCDGTAPTCLHDRVMARVIAEPEYFDDEVLDVFKGRDADSYTEEEEAMFAEVLDSVLPEEVLDWLASLEARGINLPVSLRDEACMLAADDC